MNTDKVAIAKAIESRLLSRFRALGINPGTVRGHNEEAAFLAGAATALQAVFAEPDSANLTDYVPPFWVISPMSGRSVVKELLRKEVA